MHDDEQIFDLAYKLYLDDKNGNREVYNERGFKASDIYNEYHLEAANNIRREMIEDRNRKITKIRNKLIREKSLKKVFTNTKRIVKFIKTKSVTTKYTTYPTPKRRTHSNNYNISVVPTDTITAALNVSGKTCILNMASEIKAGGGVKNGKSAQEECLFRCTNLFETVTQKFYPLGTDEFLYTKDAIILKDFNYNVLDTPRKIDCITAAAPNLNVVGGFDGVSVFNEVNTKIFNILKMASRNNCENIILGAWGCGVYGFLPEVMSEQFNIIIKRTDFKIKNIIFAVINDENSVGNNYTVFNKQFNGNR